MTYLSPIRRKVTDIADCDFYHFVDLPDGRTIPGQWDLRNSVKDYLGGYDFSGKSVLEIGPASGFLTFSMEKMGAKVTCIEPPLEKLWDFVPRPEKPNRDTIEKFSAHIGRIRNGFWFLHRALGSSSALFEADAYALPETLGDFDVSVLASLLMHCRSPVAMLESAAKRTKETMIVCDQFFADLSGQPICRLVPNAHNATIDGWWQFAPEFFQTFLAVMGFDKQEINFHDQSYASTGQVLTMYTIVASRSL